MTDAEAFFDRIAGRYDRAFARVAEESSMSLARVLECIRGRTRVLDLGVGTGRELTALQDHRHVVTGFDISAEMIDKCSRRARPVKIVRGDLWAPLPFEAASFDAVIALHGTLAHPPSIPHVRSTLGAELARVLRADGVFVAELPSLAWLGSVESADPRCKVEGRGFVFRDTVSGAVIHGEIATGEEWAVALTGFDTTVRDFGDEMMIVATRRE